MELLEDYRVEIDKIDREKVLSYGIIDNKRVLKVQYILIEDIASKEEN